MNEHYTIISYNDEYRSYSGFLVLEYDKRTNPKFIIHYAKDAGQAILIASDLDESDNDAFIINYKGNFSLPYEINKFIESIS